MTFLPNFDNQPSPLSEEIKQGVLQVNRAHYLFLFTQEDYCYVRNRKKALKDYQYRLHADEPIPPESLSFFQKNETQERQVYQKEMLYRWRKEHQQSLTNEEVWQRLIQASSSKEEAEVLKTHWQAYGALSRWSHQALVYVATELLPTLIHYHQTELVKCHNHEFLPPIDVQAYQQYLNDFLHQAKKLKQLMAESMLARLSCLGRNQFQHADVTMEIMTQLQSLQSLSKGMKLPSVSSFEPLTPQQFSVFHGYLTHECGKDFKERLLNLNWLASPTQLTLITQKKSLKTDLVPTELASFIPQSSRRPAFLFKGHYFRKNFFKAKGMVLASLMADVVYLLPIHHDAIGDVLHQLQQKEAHLDEFTASLSTQKKRFHSFQHRKTQKFLKKWKSWLAVQKEKVIGEKIVFLERLLEDFQQRQSCEFILPWELCQSIEKTLQQLQQQSTHYPLKEQWVVKIKHLAKEFPAILLTNKAYQSLKTLAEGKLIPPSDIAFLNDFYQATLLYSPQSAQAFVEMTQPFVQNLYEKLKKEFSPFGFQDRKKNKLRQHVDKVLAFHYVVGIFGTPVQQAAMQHRLLKYALHYLEALLQGDWETSLEAVKAAETVLMSVGSRFQYGSESLATWVTELKSLRGNAQWEVMAAKCKSALCVINQDLLKKRLAKELTFLDKGIETILQHHPDLNYSQASIATIFRLRDQMVEQGVTQVSQLKDLPTYQQILSGSLCYQSKTVEALLKISTKAYRVHRQIQTQTLSPLEKSTQLEKLTLSVGKVFSRAPELRSLLQSNAAFFKHRDFFSKRYVDETVSHRLTTR